MSLPGLPNTALICIPVILAICIAGPAPVNAMEAVGSTASGQQAQTVQEANNDAPNNPADPTLKLSSTEALRRFEPPADEEYTLGAGDEVSIEFPGRPELSTRGAIGPDGRITVPLAGPIVIANLTREAAAKAICSAFSPYYASVSATVQIVKYGSNHVTLLGSVKSPGSISFDQTPTLLEVLSRGGVEPRPDGSLPDQCVIYRGSKFFGLICRIYL